MYCKLCGKHLYEKLTFQNIFKLHYFIHEECEELLKKNDEYITIPVLEKLIYFDYLFEVKYDESDDDFLFEKYGQFLFERMIENTMWSIVIFLDFEMDRDSLLLFMNLAEKAVLFMSIYNENTM